MFTERVNEATAGDVKKYLIALVEYDLENRPENIFGNRSQKSEYDKIEGEIKE